MERMGCLRNRATLLWMLLCCLITMANARTVVVGGDQHWHFGVNYTDWALKAAPFHVNDVLVFKFARPNGSIFHDVHRLHELDKFQDCNLKGAQRLAHENSGVDKGFSYVLKKKEIHYFACGIRDGFHCAVGMMKFSVKPI